MSVLVFDIYDFYSILFYFHTTHVPSLNVLDFMLLMEASEFRHLRMEGDTSPTSALILSLAK